MENVSGIGKGHFFVNIVEHKNVEFDKIIILIIGLKKKKNIKDKKNLVLKYFLGLYAAKCPFICHSD